MYFDDNPVTETSEESDLFVSDEGKHTIHIFSIFNIKIPIIFKVIPKGVGDSDGRVICCSKILIDSNL